MWRLMITLLVFLLAPVSLIGQESVDKKEAVAAAEEWLTMVDAGAYDASWDSAAAYFKEAVTPENWAASLKAFREPLGTLISRRVKVSEHRTSLPGAPDGEYVVIQFVTSFENKESTVETVTPMKDPDGQWRVSGYFIR